MISASGGLELLQIVLEQDIGRCASEDAEPEGVGHEALCQQGRWAPNGGGLEDPTSIREGNECQHKGTSASEDAGPRREMDCEIPS